MDKQTQYDIVKLMNNLKESHNNKSLQNVAYLGSIDYKETIDTHSYNAQKDIFVIVEEKVCPYKEILL